MAQRSQVPPFGDWESESNVAYTDYFEKARKDNNGVKKNLNNPRENPKMFNNKTPPVQAPPFQMEASRAQKEPGTDRSKHQRHRSQEDGELKGLNGSQLHQNNDSQRSGKGSLHQGQDGARALTHEREGWAPNDQDAVKLRLDHQKDGELTRPTDSPFQHNTGGRRVGTDSPLHRHGGVNSGEAPRRVPRQSADRSTERSPLHPHHQPKIGHKGSGVSSPSSERRGSADASNHGSAPLTPGRSRLGSVNRGDESPDHSSAVPRFGDWDESNPASAESYTQIFNRVREEKQQSGAGGIPVPATPNSYSSGHRQHNKETSKRCCCFPW